MSTDFERADTGERLAMLLDADSFRPLADAMQRPGLAVGTGRIGAQQVVVAALDRSLAGGSMGVAESQALAAGCRAAGSASLPLVWCLESAGARLQEGVASLGAFRALFAEAMEAAAAGRPTIAVLPGNCFGGAALLASLCGRRLYADRALTALSGPAVVEAVSGRTDLDASDRDAVRALMGAQARAKIDPGARVCGGDDLVDAVRESLAPTRALSPAFETRHRELQKRLHDAGIALPSVIARPSPALEARLRAFGGDGFESVLGDGVLRGVRTIAGRDTSIVGLVNGIRVGAAAAWSFAESVSTAARQCPDRPVLAVIDCGGHNPTSADERRVLSDFVAHMGMAVRYARERGVPVTVAVTGASSGAVHAACTAAATRVFALPGATIRVLPRIAIESVLGDVGEEGSGPDAWIRAGVIDAVLAGDEALGGAMAR